MKRIRLVVAVATAAAVSLFGVAGTASAQSADDVAILLENAPAAGETLAAGLQGAVDTLTTTQSAEATSQALGQALVDSATVLVAGTEQFGSLGLGFFLINQGVQGVVGPYLGAIDDPATAGDLLDPEDLTILSENLQPFLDAEQATLKDGLVHLLQGNVIEPPLGIGPAFYSSAVVGTLMNAFIAATGTSLEPVIGAVGITSIVVGAAIEPQVSELEAALAPLFDGAAPVTDQIIAVIEGA